MFPPVESPTEEQSMSTSPSYTEASPPNHVRQDTSFYRSAGGDRPPQNISQRERLYSAVGGAVLLLAGLSRGKLGGLLMTVCGGALVYRGWSGHCHCYDALGIDTSEHNAATVIPAQQGVKVERTVTVNRPADELFHFWRELHNLQGIMQHIRRVEVRDDNRSHWIANAPLGQPIKWDAEIINEREPELIAWRSLPGGDVDTAGSVRFKPLNHDRGTAVTVSLKYNPPGGKVVAALASLLGSGLEQQLESDLRRFKSVMEAG
jgi:uncharacterized membrane protein